MHKSVQGTASIPEYFYDLHIQIPRLKMLESCLCAHQCPNTMSEISRMCLHYNYKSVGLNVFRRYLAPFVTCVKCICLCSAVFTALHLLLLWVCDIELFLFYRCAHTDVARLSLETWHERIDLLLLLLCTPRKLWVCFCVVFFWLINKHIGIYAFRLPLK